MTRTSRRLFTVNLNNWLNLRNASYNSAPSESYTSIYLFVYLVYLTTLSISKLASFMNWRGRGRKRCRRDLRYYSGICMEELKTTTKSSVGIANARPHLNQGPPKYETGSWLFHRDGSTDQNKWKKLPIALLFHVGVKHGLFWKENVENILLRKVKEQEAGENYMWGASKFQLIV
jgi:hypothetical protein